jgi:hypothetical protein
MNRPSRTGSLRLPRLPKVSHAMSDRDRYRLTYLGMPERKPRRLPPERPVASAHQTISRSAGRPREAAAAPTGPPSPSPASDELLGQGRPLVVHRLQQRFPEVADQAIDEVVQSETEQFRDARITTFVPLLVEHNASDALRSRIAGDSRS